MVAPTSERRLRSCESSADSDSNADWFDVSSPASSGVLAELLLLKFVPSFPNEASFVSIWFSSWRA